MSLPTPTFRSAFVLALAGALLLGSAGVASAGLSLCPASAGAGPCPMMAPAAPELGASCHGEAAMTAGCCGEREIPSALPAPVAPALAPQPALSAAALTPPLPTVLPRAALEAFRRPERPFEAGLYTLHRSLLI